MTIQDLPRPVMKGTHPSILVRESSKKPTSPPCSFSVNSKKALLEKGLGGES